MTETYVDLEVFTAFLEGLVKEQEKETKAELLKAVESYLDGAEKLEIVHCRDCNTFSTAGVAEGYGWCKKFCFGPEKDFFCFLGAPWDNETEPDPGNGEGI